MKGTNSTVCPLGGTWEESMFLSLFKAKSIEVNDVEAFDVESGEVFHPVIADLMVAQEKGIRQTPHERDYGAARKATRVSVAFV
jgi:hypothetical protein